MEINPLTHEDIDELKVLHQKFYNEEFPFPNFLQKFICHFSVSGNDGTIISGGGLRTILECVLVTNKDVPPRQRREALLNILQACLHISQRTDYEGFHVFVQEDPKYVDMLTRTGFNRIKGEGLYIKV